jgi:hypothetical protein
MSGVAPFVFYAKTRKEVSEMDTKNETAKPEVSGSAPEQKQARPSSSVIDQLFVIEKAEDKKIVVRLMEFKGSRYLDMRMQFIEKGEWKFSAGITFNRWTFTTFLDALNSHQETIEMALNAQKPDV